MKNFFYDVNTRVHLFNNIQSKNILFANNYKHVRNVAPVSSVTSSQHIHFGAIDQSLPQNQRDEIVRDRVRQIQEITGNNPNVRLSADAYTKLGSGQELDVRIQQEAPDRRNLFVGLFSAAVQLAGGLGAFGGGSDGIVFGGAAFNKELSSAVLDRVQGDADFVNKYGNAYTLNPFGGAEHIGGTIEVTAIDPAESAPERERSAEDIVTDRILTQSLDFFVQQQQRDIRRLSDGDQFGGRILSEKYNQDVGTGAGEAAVGQTREDAARSILRNYELKAVLDSPTLGASLLQNSQFQTALREAGFEGNFDKDSVKNFLFGQTQTAPDGTVTHTAPEISTGARTTLLDTLYSNRSTQSILDQAGIVRNDRDIGAPGVGSSKEISFVQAGVAGSDGTITNNTSLTTAPGAEARREVVADYLRLAVSAGLITQDQLSAALTGSGVEQGNKLGALFDNVEQQLHEKYGLVDDNKLGAQHITAIQRAIIDNAQQFANAAVAVNNIINGDEVSTTDRTALQSVLDQYNAANGTSLTIDDLQNGQGRAEVLQFASQQLGSISQDLNTIGGGAFLQHSQLAELQTEIAAVREDIGGVVQNIQSGGGLGGQISDFNERLNGITGILDQAGVTTVQETLSQFTGLIRDQLQANGIDTSSLSDEQLLATARAFAAKQNGQSIESFGLNTDQLAIISSLESGNNTQLINNFKGLGEASTKANDVLSQASIGTQVRRNIEDVFNFADRISRNASDFNAVTIGNLKRAVGEVGQDLIGQLRDAGINVTEITAQNINDIKEGKSLQEVFGLTDTQVAAISPQVQESLVSNLREFAGLVNKANQAIAAYNASTLQDNASTLSTISSLTGEVHQTQTTTLGTPTPTAPSSPINVEALQSQALGADATLAQSAVQTLRQAGTAEAVTALTQILQNSTNDAVKQQAGLALAQISSQSSNAAVAQQATNALATQAGTQLLQQIALSTTASPVQKQLAIEALSQVAQVSDNTASTRAVEALSTIAQSSTANDLVRQQAVTALTQAAPAAGDETARRIVQVLSDLAQNATNDITKQAATSGLSQVVANTEGFVQKQAQTALAQVQPTAPSSPINVEALQSQALGADATLAQSAVQTLRQAGTAEAVTALTQILQNSTNDAVKQQAGLALAQISSQSSNAAVAQQATNALATQAGTQLLQQIALSTTASPVQKQLAIEALSQVAQVSDNTASTRAVEALSTIAQSSTANDLVRQQAVTALTQAAPAAGDETARRIVQVLSDLAQNATNDITKQAATSGLSQVVANTEGAVQRQAQTALAQVQPTAPQITPTVQPTTTRVPERTIEPTAILSQTRISELKAQAIGGDNPAEAVRFLGQAAQSGDVQAARALTEIVTAEGTGASIRELAVLQLGEAAKQGNAQAVNQLVELATAVGTGSELRQLAVQTLSEAAKQGSSGATQALFEIAVTPQIDNLVAQKAVEGLSQAAQQGNSQAAEQLVALAVAANPNVTAATKLAAESQIREILTAPGTGGDARELIIQSFGEAAKQGSNDAVQELARLATAAGTGANIRELAVIQLGEAAKQGNAQAVNELVELATAVGTGSELRQLAVQTLSEAAKQGSSDATQALFQIAVAPQVDSLITAQAVEGLAQAAKQGNGEAATQLLNLAIQENPDITPATRLAAQVALRDAAPTNTIAQESLAQIPNFTALSELKTQAASGDQSALDTLVERAQEGNVFATGFLAELVQDNSSILQSNNNLTDVAQALATSAKAGDQTAVEALSTIVLNNEAPIEARQAAIQSLQQAASGVGADATPNVQAAQALVDIAGQLQTAVTDPAQQANAEQLITATNTAIENVVSALTPQANEGNIQAVNALTVIAQSDNVSVATKEQATSALVAAIPQLQEQALAGNVDAVQALSDISELGGAATTQSIQALREVASAPETVNNGFAKNEAIGALTSFVANNGIDNDALKAQALTTLTSQARQGNSDAIQGLTEIATVLNDSPDLTRQAFSALTGLAQQGNIDAIQGLAQIASDPRTQIDIAQSAVTTLSQIAQSSELSETAKQTAVQGLAQVATDTDTQSSVRESAAAKIVDLAQNGNGSVVSALSQIANSRESSTGEVAKASSVLTQISTDSEVSEDIQRSATLAIPEQRTVTPSPTSGPVVSSPTSGPVVSSPTSGPVVSSPTSGPVVSSPTSGPVVSSPTSGPVVSSPTSGPVVSSPTSGPVVSSPTSGPVVSSPTSGPVVSSPTPGPVGSSPTPGPVGSSPSPSPTPSSSGNGTPTQATTPTQGQGSTTPSQQSQGAQQPQQQAQGAQQQESNLGDKITGILGGIAKVIKDSEVVEDLLKIADSILSKLFTESAYKFGFEGQIDPSFIRDKNSLFNTYANAKQAENAFNKAISTVVRLDNSPVNRDDRSKNTYFENRELEAEENSGTRTLDQALSDVGGSSASSRRAGASQQSDSSSVDQRVQTQAQSLLSANQGQAITDFQRLAQRDPNQAAEILTALSQLDNGGAARAAAILGGIDTQEAIRVVANLDSGRATDILSDIAETPGGERKVTNILNGLANSDNEVDKSKAAGLLISLDNDNITGGIENQEVKDFVQSVSENLNTVDVSNTFQIQALAQADPDRVATLLAATEPAKATDVLKAIQDVNTSGIDGGEVAANIIDRLARGAINDDGQRTVIAGGLDRATQILNTLDLDSSIELVNDLTGIQDGPAVAAGLLERLDNAKTSQILTGLGAEKAASVLASFGNVEKARDALVTINSANGDLAGDILDNLVQQDGGVAQAANIIASLQDNGQSAQAALLLKNGDTDTIAQIAQVFIQNDKTDNIASLLSGIAANQSGDTSSSQAQIAAVLANLSAESANAILQSSQASGISENVRQFITALNSEQGISSLQNTQQNNEFLQSVLTQADEGLGARIVQGFTGTEDGQDRIGNILRNIAAQDSNGAEKVADILSKVAEAPNGARQVANLLTEIGSEGANSKTGTDIAASVLGQIDTQKTGDILQALVFSNVQRNTVDQEGVDFAASLLSSSALEPRQVSQIFNSLANSDQGQDVAALILGEVASNNPSAAADIVKGLDNEAATSIIEQLATQNTTQAAAILNQLGNSTDVNDRAKAASILVSLDPIVGENLLPFINNTEVRDFVNNSFHGLGITSGTDNTFAALVLRDASSDAAASILQNTDTRKAVNILSQREGGDSIISTDRFAEIINQSQLRAEKVGEILDQGGGEISDFVDFAGDTLRSVNSGKAADIIESFASKDNANFQVAGLILASVAHGNDGSDGDTRKAASILERLDTDVAASLLTELVSNEGLYGTGGTDIAASILQDVNSVRAGNILGEIASSERNGSQVVLDILSGFDDPNKAGQALATFLDNANTADERRTITDILSTLNSNESTRNIAAIAFENSDPEKVADLFNFASNDPGTDIDSLTSILNETNAAAAAGIIQQIARQDFSLALDVFQNLGDNKVDIFSNLDTRTATNLINNLARSSDSDDKSLAVALLAGAPSEVSERILSEDNRSLDRTNRDVASVISTAQGLTGDNISTQSVDQLQTLDAETIVSVLNQIDNTDDGKARAAAILASLDQQKLQEVLDVGIGVLDNDVVGFALNSLDTDNLATFLGQLTNEQGALDEGKITQALNLLSSDKLSDLQQEPSFAANQDLSRLATQVATERTGRSETVPVNTEFASQVLLQLAPEKALDVINSIAGDNESQASSLLNTLISNASTDQAAGILQSLDDSQEVSSVLNAFLTANNNDVGKAKAVAVLVALNDQEAIAGVQDQGVRELAQNIAITNAPDFRAQSLLATAGTVQADTTLASQSVDDLVGKANDDTASITERRQAVLELASRAGQGNGEARTALFDLASQEITPTSSLDNVVTAQALIAARDLAQTQLQSANPEQLGKIVDNLSTSQASSLLNSLDAEQAANVLLNVDTSKASEILNALDTNVAQEIGVQLVQNAGNETERGKVSDILQGLSTDKITAILSESANVSPVLDRVDSLLSTASAVQSDPSLRTQTVGQLVGKANDDNASLAERRQAVLELASRARQGNTQAQVELQNIVGQGINQQNTDDNVVVAQAVRALQQVIDSSSPSVSQTSKSQAQSAINNLETSTLTQAQSLVASTSPVQASTSLGDQSVTQLVAKANDDTASLTERRQAVLELASRAGQDDAALTSLQTLSNKGLNQGDNNDNIVSAQATLALQSTYENNEISNTAEIGASILESVGLSKGEELLTSLANSGQADVAANILENLDRSQDAALFVRRLVNSDNPDENRAAEAIAQALLARVNPESLNSIDRAVDVLSAFSPEKAAQLIRTGSQSAEVSGEVGGSLIEKLNTSDASAFINRIARTGDRDEGIDIAARIIAETNTDKAARVLDSVGPTLREAILDRAQRYDTDRTSDIRFEGSRAPTAPTLVQRPEQTTAVDTFVENFRNIDNLNDTQDINLAANSLRQVLESGSESDIRRATALLNTQNPVIAEKVLARLQEIAPTVDVSGTTVNSIDRLQARGLNESLAQSVDTSTSQTPVDRFQDSAERISGVLDVTDIRATATALDSALSGSSNEQKQRIAQVLNALDPAIAQKVLEEFARNNSQIVVTQAISDLRTQGLDRELASLPLTSGTPAPVQTQVSDRRYSDIVADIAQNRLEGNPTATDSSLVIADGARRLLAIDEGSRLDQATKAVQALTQIDPTKGVALLDEIRRVDSDLAGEIETNLLQSSPNSQILNSLDAERGAELIEQILTPPDQDTPVSQDQLTRATDILRTVNASKAAEILEYLDPEQSAQLLLQIQRTDPNKAASIVNELSSQDSADIFEEILSQSNGEQKVADLLGNSNVDAGKAAEILTTLFDDSDNESETITSLKNIINNIDDRSKASAIVFDIADSNATLAGQISRDLFGISEEPSTVERDTDGFEIVENPDESEPRTTPDRTLTFASNEGGPVDIGIQEGTTFSVNRSDTGTKISFSTGDTVLLRPDQDFRIGLADGESQIDTSQILYENNAFTTSASPANFDARLRNIDSTSDVTDIRLASEALRDIVDSRDQNKISRAIQSLESINPEIAKAVVDKYIADNQETSSVGVSILRESGLDAPLLPALTGLSGGSEPQVETETPTPDPVEVDDTPIDVNALKTQALDNNATAFTQLATAAGSGNSDALDALQEIAQNNDLSQTIRQKAIDALVQVTQGTDNDNAREAVTTLSELTGNANTGIKQAAVQALAEVVTNDSTNVQAQVDALRILGQEQNVTALASIAANSTNRGDRTQAIQALAEVGQQLNDQAGAQRAVTALTELTGDDNSQVRQQAVLALATIANNDNAIQSVKESAITALQTEPNIAVLGELARQTGDVDASRQATEALANIATTSTDSTAKQKAAEALVQVASSSSSIDTNTRQQAAVALTQIATDSTISETTRQQAATTITQNQNLQVLATAAGSGNSDALEALQSIAQNNDLSQTIRQNAIDALVQVTQGTDNNNAREAVTTLSELTGNANTAIKQAALDALIDISTNDSTNSQAKTEAVTALGRNLTGLIEAANDSTNTDRTKAIQVLAEIGQSSNRDLATSAVTALTQLTGDTNSDVKQQAVLALATIANNDIGDTSAKIAASSALQTGPNNIAVLGELARQTGDVDASRQATEALANIATTSTDSTAKQQAAVALVQVASSSSSIDTNTRQQAVLALTQVATDSTISQTTRQQAVTALARQDNVDLLGQIATQNDPAQNQAQAIQGLELVASSSASTAQSALDKLSSTFDNQSVSQVGRNLAFESIVDIATSSQASQSVRDSAQSKIIDLANQDSNIVNAITREASSGNDRDARLAIELLDKIRTSSTSDQEAKEKAREALATIAASTTIDSQIRDLARAKLERSSTPVS